MAKAWYGKVVKAIAAGKSFGEAAAFADIKPRTVWNERQRSAEFKRLTDEARYRYLMGERYALVSVLLAERPEIEKDLLDLRKIKDVSERTAIRERVVRTIGNTMLATVESQLDKLGVWEDPSRDDAYWDDQIAALEAQASHQGGSLEVVQPVRS